NPMERSGGRYPAGIRGFGIPVDLIYMGAQAAAPRETRPAGPRSRKGICPGTKRPEQRVRECHELRFRPQSAAAVPGPGREAGEPALSLAQGERRLCL